MGQDSVPANPQVFRQPLIRLHVDRRCLYENPTSSEYDTEVQSASEWPKATALPPIKTPSNTSCTEQRPEHTMYHPCLDSQVSYRSESQSKSLRNFWSASLEPPITCESLRELEWDQLLNNLLLRHDLNFDPQIQYRPITHGPRGKQRMTQINDYWDAVRVEISMISGNWSRRSLRRASTCYSTPALYLEATTGPQPIPRRLPLMFEAIRETLKTLAPKRQWYAIDERLDAALLVQQLDNGVCDFVSLSDWLGALLRPLCSPERYPLFSDMTSVIKRGVRDADTELIVNGLQGLFNILETMRLVRTSIEIQLIKGLTRSAFHRTLPIIASDVCASLQ